MCYTLVVHIRLVRPSDTCCDFPTAGRDDLSSVLSLSTCMVLACLQHTCSLLSFKCTSVGAWSSYSHTPNFPGSKAPPICSAIACDANNKRRTPGSCVFIRTGNSQSVLDSIVDVVGAGELDSAAVYISCSLCFLIALIK